MAREVGLEQFGMAWFVVLEWLGLAWFVGPEWSGEGRPGRSVRLGLAW